MTIITLIIIAVVIISIITMHNNIISNFNAVKRAWSDVHATENQKGNIITKLTSLLNEHKAYEAELVEKVTRYRAKIDELVMSPNSDKINSAAIKEVETASKAVMSGISMVAEAYPDIKSSDLYKGLMREISEQQQNVGAAIRIFNSNVERHNTVIESFPSVLVNNHITKKKAVDSFSDEAVEKAFSFNPDLD